jgi:hypothetical protein
MVARNVLDPGVPSAHLALADAAVVRRVTVSSSQALFYVVIASVSEAISV